MAPLSFQKAKDQLKPADMEKLVAMCLVCIDSIKPDHKAAAAELNMSTGGYSNAYHALLKRLRETDCYIDAGNGEGGQASKENALLKTPKKATPGRKRATPIKYEDKDSEHEEDESPSKKRKTLKTKAAVEAESGSDEGDV